MASGSVRILLRLEGLAALAIAATLFAATGRSWWLFAALFLAPDLGMLGYLANPKAGSISYNVVHTYLLPAALIAVAYWNGNVDLLPFAYIWIGHIGFDRALGYGLKYPEAFGSTHLSATGRRATELAA